MSGWSKARSRIERVRDEPPVVRDVLEAALASIRARWWLAVLGAVAVASSFAIYNASAGVEARVRIAFNPVNVVQAVFNEPRSDVAPPAAADLERTEVLTVLSRRVGISDDNLRDRLSVEQSAGEREAVLVATAPDGSETSPLGQEAQKRATALVNEWATVYVDYRRTQLRRALLAAREEIRQRADQLLDEAGQFQRREILRSLLAVEAAKQTPPDAVVVSFEGTTSRDIPMPLFILLPPLLGIGAAVAAALVDGRIRTSAGTQTASGLSVLCRLKRGSDESIHDLRSRLFDLVGASSPPMNVVIGTGERDAEGARTLALSLGESVARDGRDTVVVLDGVQAEAASRSLEQALDTQPAGPTRGLVVIQIHREAAHPPEAWEGAIQALSDRFDVVILAAPEWSRASAVAGLKKTGLWLLACTEGRSSAREVRHVAILHERHAKLPVAAVLLSRRALKQLRDGVGKQSSEGAGVTPSGEVEDTPVPAGKAKARAST